MASSSSSNIPQARSIASSKLYDAFLSHRGPDVKETLAKQLYARLQERRCRAFLDREELQGGDSITTAIRDAICSARVQIAIFSPGYAESPWCLDELVLMLQQTDALFIPVFYDVHPWELRHIEDKKKKKKRKRKMNKKKESQYAAAFSDYQRKGRNLDKLDEWKKALVSAADISGYELSQHQGNLCDEIVSRVEKEMKKWIPLHVAKYPVGLAKPVEEFERYCSKRAKGKATVVGIFGLGGVGKTTLATEFFNRKRSDYDASCFVSDIRESHARGNLHCLQSQLVDDLFKEKIEFRNVGDGIAHLKYRLERATRLHFLIVLDDIDHQDQIDALLPDRGMLSAGSLIIITTRDQNMLSVTDASRCYKMKGLDMDHSKELFSRHAFRGGNPPIAYEDLIERFVKFCGGLPLSLMVLGAQLYARNMDYWGFQLQKVQNIPPKEIMQKLKISFDGLDRQEQEIFLDIACFFNKRSSLLKEKVATVWNGAGWSAENAVQTLQEKCLVEIDLYGRFEMHDHLRDLGRQIAEKSDCPRLWRPELLRSLEANGIRQILAQTKVRCFLECFQDSQIQAEISCFIDSANDSIEPQLLLLETHSSLESIPSWIPLRKLLCLCVFRMDELWSTFQQQRQSNTQASFDLRMLRISRSPSLQRLPDLIGMFSHLERLEMHNSLEKTDPTSLVQSLKRLSNLKILRLWSEHRGLFSGNLHLTKSGAPNNIKASTSSCMNNLKSISLAGLDKISELVISGDVCPTLRYVEVEFMDNLNEMELKELERLKTLTVIGCPLLKRISGLSTLTGLESLTVRDCSTLETVSGLSSLTGLRYLKMGKCPKLESLTELSSGAELRELETEECGKLKSLPSLARQRHLERITISHCRLLQKVEVEEFQGLKNLIIEVPDTTYRYEWVRDFIYGLTSLPSESTVVVGKAVDSAVFKLNDGLFSEDWINIEMVVGITGEQYMPYLRGSTGAITVHALLLEASNDNIYNPYHYCTGKSYIGGAFFPSGCEWMITVIQCPHVTEGIRSEADRTKERRLSTAVKIRKGMKASVNEGEEEKALALLRIIYDQLYR